MRTLFQTLRSDESGATAVEYGLILALVFLTMVGAVTTVGTESIRMWDSVSEEVQSARQDAS